VDRVPDDEEFFESIEPAFLKSPPNLLEESFWAESEKQRNSNTESAIILFIG
jgi:hypothetical protein